jgi:hypothetical protein
MVHNRFPISKMELNTKVAKEAKNRRTEPFASFATFVFILESGNCFGPVSYTRIGAEILRNKIAIEMTVIATRIAIETATSSNLANPKTQLWTRPSV